MKNDLGRKFASNLTYAFTAQFFSLVVSVIMSLIVPKLLGVEQFSYWQLFIFYSSYVGFFHLGLPDGIYLRYGGTEIDKLDKPLLGSQLRVMIAVHITISIFGIVALSFFSIEWDRKYVWILTAVYMVVSNAFWFLGFVFQAANQTKKYSLATIISKVFFTICILVLMFLRPAGFQIYVLLYVMSQGLALAYCVCNAKEFVFSEQIPIKKTFSEIFTNAKIGINLTFSNLASSFILGIGRVMIDTTQGISSFGMVSLAISLTNFFLQFISQISMVMFPMLRQFEQEKMKTLFVLLRSGISYLLCAILIIYVPVKFILGLWLPQYKLSFEYLSILLPLCIFDGKMQLLYNTYLKVLRKEKTLLFINMVSLCISAILCFVGAYLLNNMIAVVIGMVIAIAIRSIITNVYLSRIMRVPNEINVFWECVLSLIFIVTNQIFPMHVAFLIYLSIFAVYCWFTRKTIMECISSAKRISANKAE